MATIVYQVSTAPRYEGWTAPQALGEFKFAVRDILDLYRRIVQTGLAHIHLQSRRNGIYRAHVDAVRALAWLEDLWLNQYPSESDDHIPWPGHLHDLWSPSSRLVLAKRFLSVTCPACKKSYGPDEVEVLPWTQGAGLAGSGGKGVLCPQGHGLYVIVEWDS